MSFNKNKAYDIFRVAFSEEESNQIKEVKDTSEDFARRNATRSGIFIKAHIDLYKKHLNVRADYFIKALLELYKEDELIDKKDEDQLVKELSAHIDSQYNFKSNNLKSLTASIGLNQAGILSVQLSSLSSNFNEIKSIKTKHLRQLIEKHNYNVSQIKITKGFWNTKNGMLTAIGTLLIAATSIIVLLINFGIFSRNNEILTIPKIEKFEIQPLQVKLGHSIKLTWNVYNADSVNMNKDIGSLPFSGSKIVSPIKSTTYMISAYLNNTTLSISKRIIVVDSLNNIINE